MEQKNIIVTQEGKVLSIKLNRPDALNALTEDMKKELIGAIETAKSDSGIRGLLLSGAGRCFCAGGDIKKMGDATPVSTSDYLGISKDLILAMSNLEKPIVAAVHGYAAGGGACLAMACDLILAAEDSKFFFSFSKVGLIPDNGGMFFLPRTIGLYRAKEVFFRAKPVDVSTMHQWGVVNQIFPSDQLFQQALEYVQELSEGPLRAIGQMKKITNRALVSDLEDVLEMERMTQAVMQTTEDHKEGIQAFKEKRTPHFQIN